MNNKLLIKSGLLIPIIFWMTTIICGFIMTDYNHATRMVSELGEIGTETQYIFTVGLVLASFFSVLFIIGLYKTCKQIGLNTIPIIILLTFSFSIFGAAIFPFPLRLHGLLGMPSILLFLSPLMTLILWKSEIISNIKIISLLIFVIMSLGFLIFVPNLLADYFGLKQRLFHFGWSVWFLYLTIIFAKLDKNIEKR
ncbi:MAG: DUF998 domain-containing protein [Bacteroidota bacterium]